MEVLKYSTVETGSRRIWFAASPKGLSFLLLRFFNERRVGQELRKVGKAKLLRDDRALRLIADQLARYFDGERITFNLELDLSRGTPFQQSVWKAVKRVPYGRLVSYKMIAERLGNPLYARAVGNALAANPIPIVIPCHRVIRSDKTLGGFSAGIRWKKALIALEAGQEDIDFGEIR